MHAFRRRMLVKYAAPMVALCGINSSYSWNHKSQRFTSLCDSNKPTRNNIMVHPEFNIRSEIEAGKEYSLTFEDGTAYEGDVMNKQMHGMGRLVLPNGVTYTGKFFNNVLIGQGEIISESGVYVGEIANWVPHGLGKMTDLDGSVCEGRFVNGVLNGHGILTELDGSVYEGEFDDNIPCGRGKYTCGEYTSEGRFENFELVEGTCTHTNGAIEEGTFVHNKLHGWGKSVWTDGTTVVGEFVNGEPSGVVTVTKGNDISTVDTDGIGFRYHKWRKYILGL